MNRSIGWAWLLAAACACSAAFAQVDGAPGAMAGSASGSANGSAGVRDAQVQRADGIEYVSGGIGSESRDALQRLQADFPLRIVYSNAAGEYFVAETVTVRNADRQLLALRSVGPILMIRLAPGDYTVNTIYAGRTEQKQVKVGSASQTVNWRW